jgi:hypothetical protein
MSVAYVQGDVFLPKLISGPWQVGETKRCEIASRGSVQPDKRGDLLLCGEKVQLAWSQSWLRADIRTQIYEAARIRRVYFHSIGRSRGRGKGPSWNCIRTGDAVECE